MEYLARQYENRPRVKDFAILATHTSSNTPAVLMARTTSTSRLYIQSITLSITTHANAILVKFTDQFGKDIASHQDQTAAAQVPAVVRFDFGPNGTCIDFKDLYVYVSGAGGMVAAVHVEGYEIEDPGSKKYLATVLGDSPIAYWRLNEAVGATSAVDRIAGYNGTPSNVTFGQTGPLTNDSTNAAALFVTASLSTILVADTAALELINDSSWECWIKMTSGFALSTILYKSPITDTTQRHEFEIRVQTTGVITVVWGDGAAASESATTGSIDSLNQPTIYKHLVVTRTGSSKSRSVYLNGKLLNTTTYTRQVATSSAGMYMGRGATNNIEYLGGALSEVAIYNTVLTPAQILAHYRAA